MHTRSRLRLADMATYRPTINDLFRPIAEVRIAVGWLLAAVACFILAVSTKIWIHLIWIVPCGLLFAHWLQRAVVVMTFRMQLHSSRLLFMPILKFRQFAGWSLTPKQAPYDFTLGKTAAPSWWIGNGFEWQPSHAAMALDMLSRDRADSMLFSAGLAKHSWHISRWWDKQKANESLLFKWAQARIKSLEMRVYGDTIQDAAPIGQSFIHAIGTEPGNVFFPEAAMPGHTLIVGAPGSGKTRLYEVLTTQAIHSGSVTIVVDPKFDADWEARCRLESGVANRPYLYFNLAQLSKSIRLNPIKNWSLPSEIASRITQLLGEEANTAFGKFAFLSIDRAVNGLLLIGEQPTLRKIHQFVEGGVGPILQKALERVLAEALGSNWKNHLQPLMSGTLAASQKGGSPGKGSGKTLGPLDAMVSMYLDDPRLAAHRSDVVSNLVAGVIDYDSHVTAASHLDERTVKRTQEILGGLISSHEHSKEHYGKMILSLLPILQMLCTGEVGDVLSPEPTDNDPRPVYDLRQVVEENAVIYLGLNTLANKTVGQAIGSILLAELAAVAGYIYNKIPERDRVKICLFVDEASQVVNDEFIMILNQGRGAGFRTFFAVQTLADFEAKLGSKSKALQLLGNANNMIALRVQDMETVKYISEKFGEARINDQSISSSQGTESDATAIEFRGSVSYSTKKTAGKLVHPDLLGRLRNLEFFAMVAGGTVSKCRIPILTNRLLHRCEKQNFYKVPANLAGS